jgi:putative transposase
MHGHDRLQTLGHRALRKGRVSLPGQIYLITVACHARRRRFARFDCACPVARVFASPTAAGDADLLAWVLMPDHWHGLLQLGNAPLAAVVRRINSLAARACNRADGSRGPVWSGAFHDRALRREDDLRACAWYLANNPVRAGLVARPHDYPFWDTTWL